MMDMKVPLFVSVMFRKKRLYPHLVVEGAGDVDVNGVYNYTGLYNSKPKYVSLNNTNIIEWIPSYWVIYFGATAVYRSNDNVATPDLCTTWIGFDLFYTFPPSAVRL